VETPQQMSVLLTYLQVRVRETFECVPLVHFEMFRSIVWREKALERANESV